MLFIYCHNIKNKINILTVEFCFQYRPVLFYFFINERIVVRLILFTIFSVVLLFSPVSLKSQVNDQLLRRANEAYETQKWKSAGTLFDLYLADSIVYSQSFKKAIISNLMAHDEMSIKKAAAMLDKYNDQTEAILKDLSKEFIRLKLLDEYEISVYRLINVRPESEKMLYNNLIN